MKPLKPSSENLFTPFEESIDGIALPELFTNPFDYEPHPLCIAAVKQLQHHLETQTEWEHNFGLIEGMEGPIIGKMFGVLVVRAEQKKIGYLSAFSGTLAGANIHSKFVPPVFDGLGADSFLSDGMRALGTITKEMKDIEEKGNDDAHEEIALLKEKRKSSAFSLTNKLFEQYHFLNQAGKERSVLEIFREELNVKPPGGAGECAAPKLLQYAFQHNMKPIAMAEFFWGLSRGSDIWQHKQYYPACRDKCAPILKHMLKGIEIEN